jgi:uncharacterized protein YcsI (UPF0317 family)
VAWGDPAQLGIVPVFWGCGVTPQSVIVANKLPFAITHEPGHMFVTDRRHEDLRHRVGGSSTGQYS